jgi:acyl-CoA thioester hydrolase
MNTTTFPSIAVDIPVRFAETDAMGIVHHSAYIVWFELGRVTWMDAMGVPYTEVAEGGNHFAVTKVEVQYRGAIRFGEVVKLETTVTTLRSRQVSFSYSVYNGKGDLAATGRTDHICVDLAGHSAKIPDSVFTRLQAGQIAGTGVCT